MTTTDTTQAIHFASPDEGEETARADLYGLLAALFAAPPSLQMLESIATSPTDSDAGTGAGGEGVLQQAWQALVTGAGATMAAGGAEAVRQEYERLFIGVGKPEVMLYGSFYLSGFMMERPLAALRTDLAQLGLERADNVFESEDHFASLCEVMRYLIAAEEPEGEAPPVSEPARLAAQKAFFGTHLQPWAGDMCNVILQHRHSDFYRLVAELARRFVEVEAQAFDIG